MSSKSKMLSFIKSFYIKLFNKENTFIMKHINLNKLDQQLNILYPKSRIKLINDYIITYPHIKRHIKDIILSTKDNQSNS
jgi:hypothetical protein